MSEYASASGNLFLYDDRQFALSAFIVASLPHQQDTIVLGPQRLAEVSSKFTDALYRGLNDLPPGPTYRVFSFEERICLAIVNPTDVPDDEGRSGTTLSLGISVDQGSTLDPSIVSRYLDVFLDTVNRAFGVDVLHGGAKDLLITVRERARHGHQVEEYRRVLDAMILASMAASQMGVRRQSLLPRLIRRMVMFRDPFPRLIIFQPSTPSADVLAALFQELRVLLRRLDVTAGFEAAADPFHFIQLSSSPFPLEGVGAAAIRRVRGHAYLILTSTKLSDDQPQQKDR